jgi:nucleoid DNA-binding protein
MKEKDAMQKGYEKIAEDLGVPKPLVEYVVRHQFNYAREVMTNGLLDNVLLHNFGTFKAKKARLDSLIKSLIKNIRSGKLDRTKGTIEITRLWKARQKK